MSERSRQPVTSWSESESALFIDQGRYYVPERELQIAAICALLPDPVEGEPYDIVELCCGEGLLSRALLEAQPTAHVLALDGSQRMLEATRETAGPLAGRLSTLQFDLAAPDWRRFERPLRAVVSSLAVHHLDGAGKRRLYADMTAALAPGGVLLLADLVAPASPAAQRLAARCWDDEVRRRALELDGHLAAFQRFQRDHWNLFSDPEPDPIDKPSSLFDQLRWLEEAGLTAIDVFWMKAGHAVFGGTKALS